MLEESIETNAQHPDQLTRQEIAKTLSSALAKGIEGSTDDAAVFYNLSHLDTRLNLIKAAFPKNTLHAIAVKANPVVTILKRIQVAGHGAEVASIGEFNLALKAGFSANSIIYDSPVKTQDELEVALKAGVLINANTLEELTVIAKLYDSLKSNSKVGIRINPETGAGEINSTSVAMKYSKFGVSLSQHRATLTQAFIDYPWLTGIHVHIGSQGMSLDQLLDGVGAVYDFFIDIKTTTKTANIDTFNIGGGLPAKYKETDTPSQFSEYATAIQKRCPDLFAPNILLCTEFGRSIHASCGWVASKVEYIVDNDSSKSTLLTHLGADMFLRKAYSPDDWHHELSIYDSTGQLREGTNKQYQVAGPLCFAGDYLSRDVSLPADICKGDRLIIHDAGAYTFSMWSLYNSRQFPAIIGYEGDVTRFECLRRRQSIDEIVAFWSCG